jgi:hypothetical protein
MREILYLLYPPSECSLVLAVPRSNVGFLDFPQANIGIPSPRTLPSTSSPFHREYLLVSFLVK